MTFDELATFFVSRRCFRYPWETVNPPVTAQERPTFVLRARPVGLPGQRIPESVIGQPCHWCGLPMERYPLKGEKLRAATRDHLIPRFKGGREIVWACYECNHAKGCLSPEEWIVRLAELVRNGKRVIRP